jgi:hypothetical protein
VAKTKTLQKEIPTCPANCFEVELDLAIDSMCKDAPEFKEVLKDELDALKKRLAFVHHEYINKATDTMSKELEEKNQNILMMENDIVILKTTILRMAVTQYGNN